MIVVFGLNDRNWHIRLIKQQVVGTLLFASCHQFASNNDPASRKRILAAPLMILPARLGQGRANEAVADIRFAQLFLTHPTSAPSSLPNSQVTDLSPTNNRVTAIL